MSQSWYNPFSIFEFPIIHFVPSPPPPKKKNVHELLFSNALGNMQHPQELLKTIVYANFGGQTKCLMRHSKIENSIREGTFFTGGGGPGYFRFFFQKSRSPPTSWNGLMHDPSKIPKQKHLTLPHPPQPIQDKNNLKWK